jgi:hypothetical protein
MYQIVPLLLALAMLIPWTGPADPGNRIAAANAADGLAEQLLIYQQAAIAYVMASPSASGVLPISLPPGWAVAGIAACAKARIVATYVTVPSTVSKPAVAAAVVRLWGGYPLAGQSLANAVTNPMTGFSLSLPCAVPDGTPVLVSQAGG